MRLGLAYRFTGDTKYAVKAASLLKAYANAYSTWKLHDNYGKPTDNGGRAYSQTLDESIWLIDIAWAYDLVRGSGQFSDREKRHIENDLLRASYQTVSKAHHEPTFNIQAWINGAIAAVGYTLHDPALIPRSPRRSDRFPVSNASFRSAGLLGRRCVGVSVLCHASSGYDCADG